MPRASNRERLGRKAPTAKIATHCGPALFIQVDTCVNLGQWPLARPWYCHEEQLCLWFMLTE